MTDFMPMGRNHRLLTSTLAIRFSSIQENGPALVTKLTVPFLMVQKVICRDRSLLRENTWKQMVFFTFLSEVTAANYL